MGIKWTYFVQLSKHQCLLPVWTEYNGPALRALCCWKLYSCTHLLLGELQLEAIEVSQRTADNSSLKGLCPSSLLPLGDHFCLLKALPDNSSACAWGKRDLEVRQGQVVQVQGLPGNTSNRSIDKNLIDNQTTSLWGHKDGKGFWSTKHVLTRRWSTKSTRTHSLPSRGPLLTRATRPTSANRLYT